MKVRKLEGEHSMKNIEDNNFFKKILPEQHKNKALFGEYLFAPIHFFHVTYSKINKLWYIKEVDGPTHSVHLSKERALQDAKDLASYEENGQVVLHHEDGLLEIIERNRWN